MSSLASIITGMFVFVIVAGAYLLPTLIALVRHVPNVGSVAVVNIALGWTFIGWVVALAMAVRSVPRPPVPGKLSRDELP